MEKKLARRNLLTCLFFLFFISGAFALVYFTDGLNGAVIVSMILGGVMVAFLFLINHDPD